MVEITDNVRSLDFPVDGLALASEYLIAVLIVSGFLQILQILAQRFARDGHHVQMEHIFDLLHHPGNASRVVEILGGPVACGADIEQIMGATVKPVECVRVYLNSELMGNGRNMHHRVGGSRDGGVDHNGVFKAL